MKDLDKEHNVTVAENVVGLHGSKTDINAFFLFDLEGYWLPQINLTLSWFIESWNYYEFAYKANTEASTSTIRL